MAGQPIEVKLDTTELRAAYVQAKAAGGGLTKDLRKAVVAAAKPLQDAVKNAASFSSRIPGAVKTKASFTAKPSVKVVVDPKRAPEAAPINNGGKGGTFRHPVHADPDKTRDQWAWVPQRAQPFFDEPIRAALPAADAAMLQALRDFEKRAGF